MKILPDTSTLQILRCPICKSEMEISPNGASLLCNGMKKHHCYDFSTGGYVNFMPPGHTGAGDSKQAVRARRDFLNLDLYRPVSDALCDAVCRHITPKDAQLVDAGCGEGYYAVPFAQKGFSVSGVDLSKSAVDLAAKRMAKIGVTHGFFAVSSVFDLPFEDNSIDAVINVFAPCAESEFMRILRPTGILAVVYAGPTHLMGLKKAIYRQTKENDGRADLPTAMRLVEENRICFDITVEGQENLQNLFAMTPYYWKTSPTDGEKLKQLDTLHTAIDMMVAIYQKSDF